MNIFKIHNTIDETFPKEEIDRLHEKGYEDVKDNIDHLLDNDKERFDLLWIQTREMINSVDARIHYWENRRFQFLQTSTALLVAAIATIVTLVPKIPSIHQLSMIQICFYIPLVLISIVIAFGSIFIMHTWNKQNNPNYPFTKAYKIWRWQYRGAEEHDLKVSCNKLPNYEFKDIVERYLENLISYKKKTYTESTKHLFDQDLSQLYLLITNEKFKIKFNTELRNALVNTIFYAFLAGILSFLFMCSLKLYQNLS